MQKKENNPIVSIVVPTYNRAIFLKKAIDSVLKQTYSYLELVIVDDYSTDNTEEMVSKYLDKRIKYLKNKSNGIIASSRNMGIRASTGEWIAFLDSDDWWTSDKLKYCIENVNNKVDLIYHELEVTSNSPAFFEGKINKSRQLKRPVLIDLLLNGNVISNSSVIVRKKVLIKIGLIEENKDLIAAEDYNTWLKISKFTDQFL